MRRYESIYVLRPDLSDEDIDSVRQKFNDIITNNGGRIILEDKWGLRTLAYEVQKHTRGYYVLLDYAADKDVVAELERNFKLHESVIRFLTVVVDRSLTPEKIETLSMPRQAQPESLAPDETGTETEVQVQGENMQSITGQEESAPDPQLSLRGDEEQ
jgi:small subunit ribosomal protein S6